MTNGVGKHDQGAEKAPAGPKRTTKTTSAATLKKAATPRKAKGKK